MLVARTKAICGRANDARLHHLGLVFDKIDYVCDANLHHAVLRGLGDGLNVAKRQHETYFTNCAIFNSGVSFNRCRFAPHKICTKLFLQ